MRLSDAIATGRVLLVPMVSTLFYESANGEHHGCALGMAGLASGGFNHTGAKSLYTQIKERFPTLTTLKSSYPCECKNILWKFRESPNLEYVIEHLFDTHIMMNKDWTLDQLIDWVRSVEPAEPQEAVIKEPVGELVHDGN